MYSIHTSHQVVTTFSTLAQVCSPILLQFLWEKFKFLPSMLFLMLYVWTTFLPLNWFDSLLISLNEVLENFLRAFCSYRRDSLMQLHIHEANRPFHHIPMMLHWTEIW